MIRTLFLLAAVLGLWTPCRADVRAVDLPVRRVVLFSSGVGYFEHAGQVDGDATATLQLKTDQMNDVLKSMVLMDFGGGTISLVDYASQDPLQRALKSFAVDISDDPDLGQLLARLRGAQVHIEAPDKITGRILGVEKHKQQLLSGGSTVVVEQVVLNLVTKDGIRWLPLDSIQGIRLSDERLAGELEAALSLLNDARDTRRKAVTIHFAGKGKREVLIGYVAETPVWKTSYRLVLGDEPMLQGWAIVENTTDTDWQGVQLALVSGRPISFIQDLYTPMYLPRPVVQPELYASLQPQLYAEGLERPAARDELVQRAREAGRRVAKAMAPAPMKGLAAAAGVRPARPVELKRGVVSIAAAEKVGELFRFEIETPVDIPRRRSAMLPIVNSPVTAQKVSIYNASVLAAHPLNGAYLTNNTGLMLPAGPVTVFDDGVYAGDAQIEHIVAGEKRLISYAVDLEVTVDSSRKTASRIVSGWIDRGVLYIKHRRLYTQVYTLKNKAHDERRLIIEHPFRPER